MKMKRYQVYWTKTAQQDLNKIMQYIATDSKINAGSVYREIKGKSRGLNEMPQQGRIVPELRYFGILNYRELMIPPWRLIYRIEADKVWILADIDGRRNVEDTLLNRFIE